MLDSRYQSAKRAAAAAMGARRSPGAGVSEVAARLVLAAVLLHSLVQCAGANTANNARLTTGFGKPKQQQETHQPPKEMTGRLCNTSTECVNLGLHNTSCLSDPRDYKHRCLCGDKTVPQNGVCKNKYRIVRFPCNTDAECVINGECMTVANILANSTMTAGELKLPQNNPSMKVCWCKDGFSTTDEDQCGNFGSMPTSSAAMILVSLLALFTNV